MAELKEMERIINVCNKYQLGIDANDSELNDEYASGDEDFDELKKKTEVQLFECAYQQRDFERVKKVLLSSNNPNLALYEALLVAKEEKREDIIKAILSNQMRREKVAARIAKENDMEALNYILSIKKTQNNGHYDSFVGISLCEAAKGGNEGMVKHYY